MPKIDALDKLLGCAFYSEDLSYPDMLYNQLLRGGFPRQYLLCPCTGYGETVKAIQDISAFKE